MSGNKAKIKIDTRIHTQTLIRPSNTTAYAAGDVISEVTSDGHFNFPGVVTPTTPKTGAIVGARMFSSANQATLPDAELWLFDADIADVVDNLAFAPTDAEMLTLVGVIDFAVANWKIGNATAGAGGNAVCETMNLNIPFLLGKDAENLDLYGQLVVRNAYTPVSAEVFTVSIMTYND